MGDEPVQLLGDAIEATRAAKLALEDALATLAEIEAGHNRRAKEPGADLERLLAERAAAEEALGLEALIEQRQAAQLWAGLLDDCVAVCNRFAYERVVIAQVGRILSPHLRPDDLRLFAMTLLRHVRHPDDDDVYAAARIILETARQGRSLVDA